MGSIGIVMFFVLSIAGLVIVAGVFLPYAAQSYLSVIEGTAAGQNHVTWPDESFIDSLWKPVFLFWLSSVWFVLLWIQFLMVAPPFAKSPAGATVAAGVVLWLFFPISLLSALSANSRLMLVYPPLFSRLRPHVGSLALAYLLTGILLSVCAGLIYLGLTKRFWMVPVAAFVSMAALLIHARILGRVAWLLYRDSVREVKKVKKEQARREKDPRHDPFPAPLPKPPQAMPVEEPTTVLPQAIPMESLPQAMPVHLAEGIQQGTRPASAPIKADEDIPEMEVEEVSEEETAAGSSSSKPVRIPVDDLPPLPVIDENMPALELNASSPQARPLGSTKDRPTHLPVDEPGLLPLDAHVLPTVENDSRSYGLLEEPKPSWRADHAAAQPPPLPVAVPVENYSLAPDDAPPTRPPMPLDGYWPVGVDRRVDLDDDSRKPLDLARKFSVRSEKPYEPRLTFFEGVFEFPFYERSLRPLVYLTVLFFLELLFVQIMIWCWPAEN